MSHKSIPQEHARSKQLNLHLQGLKNLFEDDLRKMVYYCYENFDATYADIARALGITDVAVKNKYPKLEKEQDGK